MTAAASAVPQGRVPLCCVWLIIFRTYREICDKTFISYVIYSLLVKEMPRRKHVGGMRIALGSNQRQVSFLRL